MKTKMLCAALALSACIAAFAPSHGTAAPTGAKRPSTRPISHVFVYVMENTGYDTVVGNEEEAPYLNSLIDRFALASNYQATGHASLDNYIAMTSGQPPNPATSADCFFYGTPFCIQDVDNIADQLEAAGFSWKGYMDSMESDCQHTAENTVEESQTGYTPRHNPFIYYRSIVDDRERCEEHIVPMHELWSDIQSNTVPNYSFLTPDTCHDGHDTGEHCEKGGGISEADWFARKTIPRILRSKAWKKDGLIIMTFDESGFTDDDRPVSADSGNADFGGQVFTALLTPNIEPGTESTKAYNHYGLLKTVEDIFCLDYLAGAAQPLTNSMIEDLGQERCALEQ